MRPIRSNRRVSYLPLVLGVMILIGCSDAGRAPPSLTSEGVAELQVRAMVRAWDGVTEPVCVPERVSSDLKAAIAATFPVPVEYYENREDLITGGPTSDYRCLALSPQGVSHLAAGVVGVVVWAERGGLNGLAEMQMFRWDGSEWVDTTPEETGITVTSTVS